jgi:DNA (cytosine-5)-methyltransferase 1
MTGLIIDNFAGGGGASLGIEMAMGRAVDIAINHDPEAVAMHAANHPHTLHYCQSVWRADPQEVAAGRPVALAWFSPDCKHFSKAKGGVPVEKRIRDLAWVVVLWARRVKPAVIFLENVEEFRTWGPLAADGRPCPERRGTTFDLWCRELRKLGYKLEIRQLRACDYGVPTIRKRLFIVARRDGQPIRWPQPTHGPAGSGLLPYRTAADCIDWSLPVPSIFGRKKDLKDATCRRIATGINRFVLENPRPFIVPVTHGGDNRVHDGAEPMRTITTANGGEFALVMPTLVQTGYGERAGQAPRALDLQKPLGTIVAGGGKHALVAAFMAKHYGGNYKGPGSAMDAPLSTVTTVDHNALVAAHLVNFQGTSPADIANCAADLDAPARAVTAHSKAAMVAAFMVKYYGEGGQWQPCNEPLHTVPTRDRFGLVTVTIGGEPYVIADIGMRMLSPRELARAQGFPESYQLDVPVNGKPMSKASQIARIGNSVCPPVAAAIIRENLPITSQNDAAQGAVMDFGVQAA